MGIARQLGELTDITAVLKSGPRLKEPEAGDIVSYTMRDMSYTVRNLAFTPITIFMTIIDTENGIELWQIITNTIRIGPQGEEKIMVPFDKFFSGTFGKTDIVEFKLSTSRLGLNFYTEETVQLELLKNI